MSKSSAGIACRNAWHSTFLALLPQIRKYVVPAFRHLQKAEQDDAIQDAVAHAFVMFVRLMKRGRKDAVFPTVLARFGIGHSREGRSFGTSSNSRDVASKWAHRRNNFVVNRLDRYDSRRQRWLEAVIEDPRTPVADQAAFRVDYPDWLSRLPGRNRRVAVALAYGNSTNAVARRFRLSAARVSQLRRELHESWERFHEGPFGGGTCRSDWDRWNDRKRNGLASKSPPSGPRSSRIQPTAPRPGTPHRIQEPSL